MSDIKNENDDLKDFPNYNKNKFDQIFPGIRERDEKITSLITTIESLQRELKAADNHEETLKHAFHVRQNINEKELHDKNKIIESQKEEIEKLNGVIRTIGLTLENSIKGLKEISWDAEKASFITLGGAVNFRDFIHDKAVETLSEIERLSK